MKFTDTHEWIKIEHGNIAQIGITNHAQKELGDIVYVELPELGRNVNMGQEIVVLESTKAAADVYSPASGKIIEVNKQLKDSPEFINGSPEDKGWFVKIELSNPSELDALMDLTAYQAMLKGH